MFGVPVEEVTPQLRSRAKAVNFGIVYGQQAYGLSQALDIPMAEAREMIDAYFRAYPGVRTYLDETVAFAKQTGYAETMYGRRRPIPELRVPAQRMFGERTAMNHPMQARPPISSRSPWCASPSACAPRLCRQDDLAGARRTRL